MRIGFKPLGEHSAASRTLRRLDKQLEEVARVLPSRIMSNPAANQPFNSLGSSAGMSMLYVLRVRRRCTLAGRILRG